MTKEKDFIIDGGFARTKLPLRPRNSHKGTYGRAAIVAGGEEYTGAAYLAASACLRAGAGYTTLFVPKKILPYYILKSPELLLKSTNEGGRYAFNRKTMSELLSYSSIAYGMGMGCSKEVAMGAEYLLREYEGRLVLDADGLNSLAAYKKEILAALFAQKRCDVVLTPHWKEFSRLSGWDMQTIEENHVGLAVEYAKMHKLTLLLKSAYSVITDGNFVGVNVTGNSGQAKGGSGDVLSGILTGLCAMGANCLDSACAGSYLAGKAAEIAAETLGEYSLTASDCIDCLGRAFCSLT